MKVVVVGAGLIGGAVALELAPRAGSTSPWWTAALPARRPPAPPPASSRRSWRTPRPGPSLDLGLAAAPPGRRGRGARGALRRAASPTALRRAAGRLHRGRRPRASRPPSPGSARGPAGGAASPPTAARALEPGPSPNALAAAHFPDDHQVDNRPCARPRDRRGRAPAPASAAARVRAVVERVGRAAGVGRRRLAALRRRGGPRRRRLVRGASRAPKSPRRAVQPVRGQMLELSCAARRRSPRSSPPRAATWCRGPTAALLAGSTMEDVGFDKRVTAAGVSRLLAMALDSLPCAGARPRCAPPGPACARHRATSSPSIGASATPGPGLRHRPPPQRRPAGPHHGTAGDAGCFLVGRSPRTSTSSTSGTTVSPPRLNSRTGPPWKPFPRPSPHPDRRRRRLRPRRHLRPPHGGGLQLRGRQRRRDGARPGQQAETRRWSSAT